MRAPAAAACATATVLIPPGALAHEARALAARFGLPAAPTVDRGLVLRLQPLPQPPGYRLELASLGPDAPGAMAVEFTAGPAAHRRRFGGGRGQPLARAVGLKGNAAPVVADLTAGLGRDAFVLASLGAEVWLVERCGALAALLDNGLARAAAHPDTAAVAARMHPVCAEGAAWLAGRSGAALPDVVYLDPMYPERRKSALVKKEMRLVRAVAGADHDAPALLAMALERARRRVVVKRPRGAAPLPGPPPAAAVTSTNTRYDLYFRI